MNYNHYFTNLINHHSFPVIFLDLNQVQGFETKISRLIDQIPDLSVQLLYLVANQIQEINQCYLDLLKNKLAIFGIIIWEIKVWDPKLVYQSPLKLHKLVINYTKTTLDYQKINQLITYYQKNYHTQEVVFDYHNPILLTDQKEAEKLLKNPFIQGINAYYAPNLFNPQKHLFFDNLIVDHSNWRIVGWGDLLRINYPNSYVQYLAQGFNYLGLSNHAISRYDDVYYHNTYHDKQEVHFLYDDYLDYWSQIQDEIILYFQHHNPDKLRILTYLENRKFFRHIGNFFAKYQNDFAKWTIDNILVFLNKASMQRIMLNNFKNLLRKHRQFLKSINN